MSKKKLPLLYLEWVDAVADPENNWKDPDGTDEFFDRKDNMVRETGFLWHEDDDFVCLISKWMPSDDVPITAGRTKIPKRWILKRQKIKY